MTCHLRTTHNYPCVVLLRSIVLMVRHCNSSVNSAHGTPSLGGLKLNTKKLAATLANHALLPLVN